MKILVIILWVVVYVFFGIELGYTATSPWWTHFTYSIQHGSVMHLLLNSVAFFYMMRALESRHRPWVVLAVAYAISVGASFVVYYPKPVVGASGMIYAMIGMFAFMVMINLHRFKGKARTNNIVFLFSVAVMLIISLFNPHSAGLIHLVCLVAGAVWAWIIRLGKVR